MAKTQTVKQRALKSIDAELRAELEKRRKAIDAYLTALKAQRRAALEKARHTCKKTKERASARSQLIRESAKAEIAQVRAAAQSSCERGRVRAKATGKREAVALLAERRQVGADKRALQTAGKKLRQQDRRKPKRGERSDEVLQNISPELHPVWRAVRGQFKPHSRKSLTEQFLQWVEENPDEVLALQDPAADRLVKEAEAESRALSKVLRSRRKLRAEDWERIGASPDELVAVGLNPDDPDDVLAFVGGYTQHWADKAAAVPF